MVWFGVCILQRHDAGGAAVDAGFIAANTGFLAAVYSGFVAVNVSHYPTINTYRAIRG